MKPLEKKYRSAEIANHIRTAIGNREFHNYLPSERKLSSMLNVGRDQVHQAIKHLRQMGIIELRGRRNHILSSAGQLDNENKLRKIVLLSCIPFERASALLLYTIDQLRIHFSTTFK